MPCLVDKNYFVLGAEGVAVTGCIAAHGAYNCLAVHEVSLRCASRVSRSGGTEKPNANQ